MTRLADINSGEDLTAFHEGRHNTPYWDQFGFPTNGIGHKLSNVKWAPLDQFPVVSDDQVDAWWREDQAAAEAECQRIFGPLWAQTADARRAAFRDMAFEMGEHGLGQFHDMISAFERGDWDAAAAAAKASLWDRQVPHRAAHDEALIRTGDWASLAQLAA